MFSGVAILFMSRVLFDLPRILMSTLRFYDCSAQVGASNSTRNNCSVELWQVNLNLKVTVSTYFIFR